MTTEQQATETTHQGPYFSIVIAVRNREEAIIRCLNSILGQDFDDFEVLPVDGNSTDNTVGAIEALGNPRVRVVREQENSGMWGARILGFRHALGRWVVMFDSDDEMTEGALGRLHERTAAAPADVGIIGATYRDDGGNIHPSPAFPAGPFGFEENLKWLDRIEHADYIHVFRKELLEQVELPPPLGQGNYFELKVFDNWRKDISEDICGLIHTDAADRLSGKGAKFNVELFVFKAGESAVVYDRILGEYGPRLKAGARRFFIMTCRQAGLTHMAAGHRLHGAKQLLRYLLRHPADVKAWGLLLLGLIGPRALIWGRRRLA